jgi:hypothetical protein
MAAGSSILGGSAGLAGIGIGAVAGAVGSIAGQAVGNAIGAQNGFSWKEVALGALSAGVTAGVGEFAAAGDGVLSGPSAGAFAGRAAVSSALTQGLAVATGLQHSFSWREVAASAAGAGVGAEVGGAMSDVHADPFASRLLTGFAAGTTTAVLHGGRVSVQQIATDAFGQALGNGFVDAMSNPGQQTQALANANANAYGRGGNTQSMGAGSAGFAVDDEISGGAISTPVRPYSPDNSVPLAHMADLPRSRPPNDWDSQSLPSVQNLYQPVEGFFQSRYRMAQSGLTDPNASLLDIGVNTVLGAALLPFELAETPVTAAYNSLNNFHRGGQYLARADMTSDTSDAVSSRLAATVEISNGTVGLLGAAALVPARPATIWQAESVEIPLEAAGQDAVNAARLSEVQAQGHALERHGGSVSDADLIKRAYTGVAPDGSALSGGRTPDSSAFYSNRLLVQADDFLRQNALNDAISNAAPGQVRLTVSGDMGVPLGRGYLPVGKVTGLDGPLLRVDNITTVQGTYVYNPAKSVWDTLTIFPLARPK